MASFRLGPLKSPNHRLLNHHTPPFSIDPSQLQVSLEQTQGSPTTPQVNRSSGKSSPLRGRCVKEYEEQLQQLQHENFNLKLRVFLLEERVGKALGRSDAADIIKNNIELKVENENLKKSLAEKCQLLSQASGAIEDLESQQKISLAAFEAERLSLQQQLEQLKLDLAEAEEARKNARLNPMPDESTDLYAQAFGSFVLNPQQLNCNYPDHCSKAELDEMQTKVDLFLKQAATHAEEMGKMTEEVNQSQALLQEYQQKIRILESEVVQFGNSRKDSKIGDLTSPYENKSTDEKLSESKRTVDKIIEEKQQQLEQQNKILVEIQITLDEKQKQIGELEESLSGKKKKIEELEKSLTKAGRSLQGFVADIQKKEKELEHLRVDGRKKDKKVKDLTAELKEAQELLNKAKWEAEVSGKEDNIKAMAEEENERLWAELEEKKKLLMAAEQQRAILQQDADQLVSLKLAVGQKEQAIVEAEMQIADLKRQMSNLQREMNSRNSGSFLSRSEQKSQHSIETSDQQQQQLTAQLANYIRERNELTATVQSLQEQLIASRDATASGSWKALYEESQKKGEQLEVELERLRGEVRSWQKRAESGTGVVKGDHQMRLYKKEVTVLRQRLADSTNACDLLRTRLEEMADFLEEILSMSQQELVNLSNWSAASKRRQALQHSIMQSRELSRTLSQSLMIGVDPEEPQQSSSSASTSSNCSVKSEQPANVSRKKSIDNLPGKEEIGCQAQMDTSRNPDSSTVENLRAKIFQLEEQMKERDDEVAKMKTNNNMNKSMQTDHIPVATESNKKNNLLVSSTPYHRPPVGQRVSSLFSPVSNRNPSKGSNLAEELFPVDPSHCSAKDSLSPPKVSCQRKAGVASESEAWSEPDRTVSFARIGLSMQHHMEANSIAALLTQKKTIPHSNGDPLSSCDSSDLNRRKARRSRSDPCEIKRSGNRVRSLEQENAQLRSQLANLTTCLRATYTTQFTKEESVLLDDSQAKEKSIIDEDRRCSIDDLSGASDFTTAQFIIDALKGRLSRMKEIIKKRDSRLREAKDLTTQLELKIKEKYFQACENQLLLKETQEKLQEKIKEVELLEARWIEAQSEWMTVNATKERQFAEFRSALENRDMELRASSMKAQLWENSYNDSQKTARQLESELKAQQELFAQSKTLLEQQVLLITEELEAVKEDRNRLQKDVENLKEQMTAVSQPAVDTQTVKRNSVGIQRQASQLSDYVSDHPHSEEQVLPLVQRAEVSQHHDNPNSSRPNTLHLSPDLGIDSDPGRFSSLEHSATAQKENYYRQSRTASPKQTEPKTQEGGLSPDVLNSSTCANCPRWQNKYMKAKQTLAATLEKLQVANLRKEKVDRALNKELGKTHNILCQARGLLEQANHANSH